jgi:hypothetical protein
LASRLSPRVRCNRHADLDRTVVLVVDHAVIDDERCREHAAVPFCGSDQAPERRPDEVGQLPHEQVALLGEHQLLRDVTLLDLEHLEPLLIVAAAACHHRGSFWGLPQGQGQVSSAHQSVGL